MVRRKDDIGFIERPNLFGAGGVVKTFNLLSQEELSGAGRVFGINVLSPGTGIGMHKHVGEQEAYYILKGEALYNDNGEEIILKAGDVAYCKDGETHGVWCHGEDEVQFIALITYTK